MTTRNKTEHILPRPNYGTGRVEDSPWEMPAQKVGTVITRIIARGTPLPPGLMIPRPTTAIIAPTVSVVPAVPIGASRAALPVTHISPNPPAVGLVSAKLPRTQELPDAAPIPVPALRPSNVGQIEWRSGSWPNSALSGILVSDSDTRTRLQFGDENLQLMPFVRKRSASDSAREKGRSSVGYSRAHFPRASASRSAPGSIKQHFSHAAVTAWSAPNSSTSHTAAWGKCGRIPFSVEIDTFDRATKSDIIRNTPHFSAMRVGIIPYTISSGGVITVWLGRDSRTKSLTNFAGRLIKGEPLITGIKREVREETHDLLEVDSDEVSRSPTIYSSFQMIVFYKTAKITEDFIAEFNERIGEKSELVELVPLTLEAFYKICLDEDNIYRVLALTVTALELDTIKASLT